MSHKLKGKKEERVRRPFKLPLLTVTETALVYANDEIANSRPATLTYSRNWVCKKCHNLVPCGQKCPDCGECTHCE